MREGQYISCNIYRFARFLLCNAKGTAMVKKSIILRYLILRFVVPIGKWSLPTSIRKNACLLSLCLPELVAYTCSQRYNGGPKFANYL